MSPFDTPLRSPAISLLCLHVTLTPDLRRIRVFARGIPVASTVSIPIGGKHHPYTYSWYK